jgi:tail tube protein
MADSQAIVANLSTFQRGDGGTPEVFTAVAEVSDIVPGAPTSADIDVTHLTSTAREKRAGLPDLGEMTVTMNLIQGNTVQEAMEDEAGLNVVRHYRVMHPDGVHGRQYTLILKTFGTTGYVVDGKIQAIATFAVSGKPTRLP